MPLNYSINFNIPNANPFVPRYAQTPIPMHSVNSINPINPINHMNPMNLNNPMNPINPVPMAPVQMHFGQPLYAPYQPDIIKNYDVKISTGDLGNIKHIYQDKVPKNNSNHPDRYATITERINIANYYGLIFNKHYYHYDNINLTEIKTKLDTIDDKNLSNLLGHIKVNNFNSYYSTNDPVDPIVMLTKAPANFIMFNVCFPIEYNNNYITCAEDSLRGNVRIYKLFDMTDSSNKDNLNKVFFELLYYKKIQDFIKNKKYPNFVLLYGAFLAPCKIDFNNINELKNINNLSEIYYNTSIPDNTNSLLILTESVNYNILQWATKQYKTPDNNNFFVSTVISTGVRSVEAWKSVIFQLLVAIYILDSNKIGFKNFTLKDNVFIKKIDITPPTIKYWKYIIDGTEYYVPNHSFLVMIDSSFSDDVNNIIIGGENKDHTQPLSATTPLPTKYVYNDDIKIKGIIKEIFSNFVSLIENSGGSKPPEDIVNIFDSIVEKVSDTSTVKSTDNIFKTIIHDNFRNYLYEKLGHIIPESELNEYKLLEYDKNFKIGDLVFYKKFSKAYIISSYAKKDYILTNNSSLRDYDETNIDLKEVKISEDLIAKFVYKSNKEIIETYNIP
jgi:hypothetical protein